MKRKTKIKEILESVKSKHSTTSVIKYLKWLRNNKIVSDPGFQSSAEDSRWLPEAMSSYITSVIMGMAPSPYVFANVIACLQYAKSRGHQKDIVYYSNFLKHIKEEITNVFLNVDSFNRNYTLTEFLKGNVTLEHKIYNIEGVGLFEINDSGQIIKKFKVGIGI